MTIAANALVMTLYERASTGAAAITNTAQVSQLFPFLVTGAISLLCLVQIPSKAGAWPVGCRSTPTAQVAWLHAS